MITYSYPSALHSDSATVSKMSLVAGVSRPSVQSLPDSPFSENMAKPSVWNLDCCGVSGFGSDNSDSSGAIDTRNAQKCDSIRILPFFPPFAKSTYFCLQPNTYGSPSHPIPRGNRLSRRSGPISECMSGHGHNKSYPAHNTNT